MANELVLASPVSALLQGRQAAQQNQLTQMQIQQAQDAQRRDAQFRQALPAYLTGGTNALAALYAADPERAMQAQQFVAQQNQLVEQQRIRDAKTTHAQASAVLNSASPARYMVTMLPKIAEQLAQQNGKSPAELTDEEAIAIATQVRDQAAVAAGITPEYTTPEAGQAAGRDIFFQTDKSTGQTRVLSGVQPRPQKPTVQIDMGQKFEGSAERSYGEAEGKAFQDVLQRGQDAQDKAGSIRAMYANPAITGPTQDFRAAANSFFADLGVPIAPGKLDQIGNLSQYKAIQNQLVLGEQLKQKGPQTESDAKRIAAEFGSTKNIADANKLILKYQLALADRETLLGQLTEDYRARTGKIDGWRKEYRDYVRRTPLAGVDPESKRLVFWNEFADAMREDNPSMSEDQIMDYWRKRYGGNK